MMQVISERRKKANEAFTMIEILVVVMIIGSLAAWLIPGIFKRMAEAKVGTTKTIIVSVKNAITEYSMHMGHIPQKREGGLDALIEKPSGRGSEKWDGPYLTQDDVPVDSWGNEFIYRVGADIKNKKHRYYELISLGSNNEEGGTGTAADINMGE